MKGIKKYEYTAAGGETNIKNPDFFGREIMRVRRDGISKKITVQATRVISIEDKEVSISPYFPLFIFFATLTGTGQKLQPGEIIEVLYK